jgi:hypothetical protein
MRTWVYQPGGARSVPRYFDDRSPDVAAMIGFMHPYDCGVDHGDGR